MSSFAQDIKDAAGKETIRAVIIAPFDSAPDEEDHVRGQRPVTTGSVLDWTHARPMLDYEYDGGFGAVDVHAFYAYTDTRVLFLAVYDGSHAVVSLPRNPDPDKTPTPYGGG